MGRFPYGFFVLACLISGLYVYDAHGVFAHVLDYGAINTELCAEGNQIKLHTEVPQIISYDVLSKENQFATFTSDFSHNLAIQEDGRPCSFRLISFDITSKPNQSLFDGVYSCPAPITDIERLAIHNSLYADQFRHFNHFVTFSIENKKYSLVFSTQQGDFPADVVAKYLGIPFDYITAIAVQFLRLGITHILTGYDHILFLLSVVLLIRSLKKILILVTSFTVAHSVTLFLASFHIIQISPHIVEPIIALTILYMALRNIMILRKPHMHVELSERWLSTFGFGLVHGLGFASALLETDVPKIFFVPSLLIFNIGIEIGQLGILAMALPLLFKVDTLAYSRNILIAASVIVGSLALLWFFQRL